VNADTNTATNTNTAYEPPEIINLIGKLPTAHPEYEAHRKVGEIVRIVVHYDDEVRPDGPYDPVARYISQARYHIQKNWAQPGKPPIYGFGLMYHYKVAGDGRLFATQPETLITWNSNAWNPGALAICLDCGDGQMPTCEQLDTLHKFLMWVCYHRPEFPAGRKDVWGHGEGKSAGNNTNCPGPFLQYVQAYRGGKW